MKKLLIIILFLSLHSAFAKEPSVGGSFSSTEYALAEDTRNEFLRFKDFITNGEYDISVSKIKIGTSWRLRESGDDLLVESYDGTEWVEQGRFEVTAIAGTDRITKEGGIIFTKEGGIIIIQE